MTDAPPSPPRRRAQEGVVVPAQPRWHGRLAARVLHAVVRLLAASLRWQHEHHPGAIQTIANGRVIFAIWHNRLALCLPAYQHAIQHAPGRHLAALVSASRDGGVLAQVLRLFHVLPVRGSSSRRGAQALRELVSAAKAGHDLALTPDGPRGPRYEAQEGVLLAAQFTGLPIVPAAWSVDGKISLRSWDGFQIPLPLSRCVFRLGEPIHVPRSATPVQREELRQLLAQRLRMLTQD